MTTTPDPASRSHAPAIDPATDSSDPDARLDPTREVRAGESLAIEPLSAWLAAQLDDFVGPLEVRQFPSGHSNLTYALAYGPAEARREVVLRRPPFGAEKIAKGHDMGREFRILSGIRSVWDKVPRALAYCDDPGVIGAPFYVMERLRGTILRGARPRAADGTPLEGLTPDVMRRASETLIDTLIEIHGLDIGAAGLDTLGRPEGYVTRQVEGWTERYRRARTDDIVAMEHVAAWLHANRPPESGATLVHNDFKYDNLVLDPDDLGQVRGVLDWELATIGDPLMDLGTTLAYWVQRDDSPALHALPVGPTALDGNLDRTALAARYAQATGRSLEHLLFYYVFALFKVAGIGQQIYFRYRQGDTQDPRFAMLIHGVRALAETAQQAISRSRI